MKKLMNEENKIGYYAIIPATVLFNENIKANQKLLYAVITVLSNKEGYCYASNVYLGDLLNAQPHTISKWVSHLKELGFVCLDIIKNDKGEIIQRRIYPNDTPYAINRTYPYTINRTEGMSQKGQYNNIIDNNINNNILSNLIENNVANISKVIDKIDYETIFKKNIEYDILIQDIKIKDLLQNITDIAIETLNTKKSSIYINSEPKATNVVRSQLLKLNSKHIQYVINCLQQNRKEVKSIKSYILTTLYNSVNTMNIDTTLQVARIMRN